MNLGINNINKNEKQFIFKIFDILKDEEGLIDIEPLFLFLLCLLKLYKYYMIKCFGRQDIDLSEYLDQSVSSKQIKNVKVK